jgi:hypothetical protein
MKNPKNADFITTSKIVFIVPSNLTQMSEIDILLPAVRGKQ